MTYQELLGQLYALGKQGIKLGLNNIRDLCHSFNDPQLKFASIHIAGTNGKGSVATKIAKTLQLSGKKVGLYTSPHISTFRERIQINGNLIGESETASLLSEILPVSSAISSTFFETTTLLAFLYFARQKVDVAVLETGLGGRLDATNVVTPLLSVITSISFDHTELLGSTLTEITHEKAGIIKPNVPVVIGPNVSLDPIYLKGSTLTQVEGVFNSYDEENQAIARASLKILGVPLNGLKIRPPCRLEEIYLSHKLVILDVAHNPDGLTRTFSSIKQKWGSKPLRVICNLSKNKDVKSCLDILKSNAFALHFIKSDSERLLSLSELHSLVPNSFCHQTLGEALIEALQQEEIILICGSFFIMADAREALGLKNPRDPCPIGEAFTSKPLPL